MDLEVRYLSIILSSRRMTIEKSESYNEDKEEKPCKSHWIIYVEVAYCLMGGYLYLYPFIYFLFINFLKDIFFKKLEVYLDNFF